MKLFIKTTFIFLVFTMTISCSSVFFYPRKTFINNPALDLVAHENIFFKTTDDLVLHGIYLKAKGKSLGTVLFLHGTTENLSTQIDNVLWLTGAGYDVFAFDYRGYGRSDGRPSLKGVHQDAEAALETLLTLTDKENDHLFIFGQSLGGAIAVYLSATSPYKEHIKGLIIDSAFSDYRLIAQETVAKSIVGWPFQHLFSFLIDDSYSPVKWVKKINPIPLLIIHGDKDATVATQHSFSLYDAALNPKELWLMHNVGHGQALDSKDVKQNLLTYLRIVDGARAQIYSPPREIVSSAARKIRH